MGPWRDRPSIARMPAIVLRPQPARWPLWLRIVLVVTAIYFALPWLLRFTLWYWDRAFGAGAALNWLAPKV